MRVDVAKDPANDLEDYARVPIAFKVRTVLDVLRDRSGIGGFRLSERRIDVPYIKDYDALPVDRPAHWAKRFGSANYTLFAARALGRRVGSAALVFNAPQLSIVADRQDVALLWDIRVAPEVRRQGVGAALFRSAEQWTAENGFRQLKIETQNINVAACRLYEHQGCTLSKIDRFAVRRVSERDSVLVVEGHGPAPEFRELPQLH